MFLDIFWRGEMVILVMMACNRYVTICKPSLLQHHEYKNVHSTSDDIMDHWLYCIQ